MLPRLAWQDLGKWGKVAIAGWLLVLCVISVRLTFAAPRSANVYQTFVNASQYWLEGHDLYCQIAADGHLDDYRYSPSVAVLLVPLSLLPDRVGGILWRWLSAAILLGALAWFCRSAVDRPLSPNQRAALFLLILPLCAGNLNNGQSNPLLLGLLLASVAACADCRWNIAAACLTIACLLKVYPIALGLLLVVVYPRQLGWRLTLGLAGGFLLPFLTQRPLYVIEQYGQWIDYLGHTDRQRLSVEGAYRDFRLLCRVWLVPIDGLTYAIVQLASAAAMAALCLYGRLAGWPPGRLLPLLLGLACCWMTLFGVASESATYMLIAPSIAWAILQAQLDRRSVVLQAGLWATYALFAAAQFANWFPDGAVLLHSLGSQPLATLLLLIGLLAIECGMVRGGRARPAEAGPVQDSDPESNPTGAECESAHHIAEIMAAQIEPAEADQADEQRQSGHGGDARAAAG